MRYDIYVTVWGERWVRRWQELSLASQLAGGNLAALAAEADVAYWVYTDAASADLFDEARAEIERFGEFRLLTYEDVAYRGGTVADALAASDPAIAKHNVQRLTSQHFLRAAAESAETAMVLLDSDFVFSAGSWADMHAKRLAGIRAYAVMMTRLVEETAAPIVRAGGEGAFDACRLVGLCAEHLHPIARGFFVDAEPFTPYPSQLNWRAGEAGFVTHCFFPHPLMVIPDKGAYRYSSTMDYDYALRAVADDAAIHLVPSSDDMLMLKLTPEAYLAGRPAGARPTIETMAAFVVDNTNIRHRRFAETPIRYVAQEDEAAFAAAEALSARFMEAVYLAAELIIARVQAEPRVLAYAKSFLGPIEDYMSPQVRSQLDGWLPRHRR